MSLPLLLLLQLAIAICCDATSRYVKLPVIHSTNKKEFADLWEKRAITTVPLANRSDVAYYAKLNIGTPAQQVYVQLDTGSFELWVNPDCSALPGSTDVRFCQAVGHYNQNSSSTARQVGGGKVLQYGIGAARIQYVADSIGLSGTDSEMKSVQFGVATKTEEEYSGILGIGYGQNITIPYKNFIDQLAAQGVTNTKAFSLALGSKSEEEGVVIFGGLDRGKFTGTLRTLPIVPAEQSPDQVPRYWVRMQSMSRTPPTGDTKQYANTSMDVFLDSGATLSLLPTDLANTIAADFGAEPTDEENGLYLVDCSLNDKAGTVNFEFDGVTIQVPYSEMVREVSTGFGTECYLGITPSDEFTLLGDTMLRSAYAVFDQTNNAIHLAQYVNCDTTEVEITAQTNMSSITGTCEAPDFRSDSTASAANGTIMSGNGTASQADSGSSDARKMLPGIHGWVGVLLTLVSVVFQVNILA